jgi:hypothetical protein
LERVIYIDLSDNLHPYECLGPGDCIHCDKKRTENHDPERCALCVTPELEGFDFPDPNGLTQDYTSS